MEKTKAMRRTEVDPTRDVLSLRDTISGLFDDFFSGRPLLGGRALGGEHTGAWAPAVDIRDTDQEILVLAAIPGVDKGDVQLEVKDSTLVLSGKTQDVGTATAEEEGWLRRELPHGQFYRAFALPADVKAGEVKASCKNGLLEIHLPKTEEAQARKVQIQ